MVCVCARGVCVCVWVGEWVGGWVGVLCVCVGKRVSLYICIGRSARERERDRDRERESDREREREKEYV
jgi:hypothetical protein